MKKWTLSILLGALALGFSTVASAASAGKLRGDYLETRSADVYTGFCVANSEVGLTGDTAILAWKIKEGSWNGVALDGLSVVAVTKASATLGDPFHNPFPAKSILIVDSRASTEQQAALAAFAQSTAKELLANVVKTEVAPIVLEMGDGSRHGYASLNAGSLAAIETRPFEHRDHLCGNEDVYYPPLTELQHSMPVYTLNDEFSGKGLGVTWKLNGKCSSFMGHFSYATPAVISLK